MMGGNQRLTTSKAMDFKTILLIAGIALVGIVALVFTSACIRKIQPGRAGVKTGWGGRQVVYGGSIIVLPLIQRYQRVSLRAVPVDN